MRSRRSLGVIIAASGKLGQCFIQRRKKSRYTDDGLDVCAGQRFEWLELQIANDDLLSLLGAIGNQFVHCCYTTGVQQGYSLHIEYGTIEFCHAGRNFTKHAVFQNYKSGAE